MRELILKTQETPYLHLLMGERLASVAKNQGLTVTLPEQKVVLFEAEKNGFDDYYCVVEKSPDNVPTVQETVTNIAGLSPQAQTALADTLCQLIQRSGFVEASFSNIRVRPKGGIVFLHTPNSGPFLLAQDRVYNTWPSVEKCGRIGLIKLEKSAKDPSIAHFKNQVKKNIIIACKWRISISMVLLTIFTCFIFSLIQVIRAYIAAKVAQSAFKRWSAVGEHIRRETAGSICFL
jgi:hypothetical protein